MAKEKSILTPHQKKVLEIISKGKGYSFKELLMKAKAKFDWDISLIELGARSLEASKLTDYPRMLKKIDHKEWKDFFLNEAKKLKKEIFQ